MSWGLITGASEGIGRALAGLAAADGMNLVLSARGEERLNELARELKIRHGVEVAVIPADLSRTGEAERLWALAREGREIEVLVNNAGLGRNGAFDDAEGWARERQSIEVNVTSATVLMKMAAVEMVARGRGGILNVASLAGFLPGPNMAVYHATKAYFLSLSEAAGSELASKGVVVTALCPGATETEFFRADDADHATWLTRIFPLPTALSVAEAGWRGLKRGKRIVVPGTMNKVFAQSGRVAPRKLAAWITGQLLKRR